MLAVFLLLSILGFGSYFTQFFFPHFKPMARLSTLILTGLIISGWLLFISAKYFGYELGLLSTTIIGLSLIINLIASNHLQKSQSLKIKWQKIKKKLKKANWLLIVSIIAWSGVLTQLSITHNFLNKQGAYYSGGGAYGDLALHSTLIHFFGLQPNLDLTSPIYAQQPTAYPFMIDFIAGQLLRSGWSLQLSLIITNLPIMIALILLIYVVIKANKRSTRAWNITLLLFLLNGGVGIAYFFQDWQKSNLNLFHFLLNQPFEYAHLADKNLRWSNIITDYLLPQRGMVVGLAIFALFLVLFFQINRNNKISLKKSLAGMSILIGLSPWWHIHTYITLLPLFGWSLLWWRHQRKLSTKDIVLLILPAVILSIPQLYWQFTNTMNTKFMHFQPGWMKGNQHFILFWIKNMGLEIFIWLGSICIAYKQIKQKKRCDFFLLIFPLIILFILTNLIIFQPHDYDNMKFMLFSYLGVCVVTALWLDKNWPKKNILKIIAIVLITFTISTGFVSVIREMTLSWKIANQSSIMIATKIKQKTNPEGIFLTSDEHNHPVSMLAGRKILLGYRGWLWTHGIDYSQTVTDIELMFAGTPRTLDLLKKYRIKYIYIGENERKKWQANLEFFDQHFPKIISDPNVSIYQVN